jgi:hypothetical protein
LSLDQEKAFCFFNCILRTSKLFNSSGWTFIHSGFSIYRSSIMRKLTRKDSRCFLRALFTIIIHNSCKRIRQCKTSFSSVIQ